MATAPASARRMAPKGPKAKGPHGETGRSLEQKLKKLEDLYGADAIVQIVGKNSAGDAAFGDDGLGQHGPDAKQTYPVRLFQTDPYDTNVALKLAAPDNLGLKTLGEQDLEWLRRKSEASTKAEFKQFVASMYNRNDPAQQALMNKVYPELMQEQLAIIDDRFDLIKQLTKMKALGGPQTQDDVRLLFALQSGTIALPTGDMWNPGSWNEVAKDKAAAIKRGLFSPVTGKTAGKMDSTMVPFDVLNWALKRGGDGASVGAAATVGAIPGGLFPRRP